MTRARRRPRPLQGSQRPLRPPGRRRRPATGCARCWNASKRQIDGARAGGRRGVRADPARHRRPGRLRDRRAPALRGCATEFSARYGRDHDQLRGGRLPPATARRLARFCAQPMRRCMAAKDSGRNRTVLHSPALSEHVARRAGRPRDIAGGAFHRGRARPGRGRGPALQRECTAFRDASGAMPRGWPGSSASPSEHVGRVRLAGMLHDIGKVGVPDSHPAEARQAHRGGVRDDQAPPRARGADPGASQA